jgi:hypothetical protein
LVYKRVLSSQTERIQHPLYSKMSNPHSITSVFSQLSIQNSDPPLITEGTPHPTTSHAPTQTPSLLSILTIEDMTNNLLPSTHSNHPNINSLLNNPSIINGRHILSWSAFANIILILEDFNCPTCAKIVIHRTIKNLPFYEDHSERLEDSVKRVGGITIMKKWYTLLFWAAMTSDDELFIPGVYGIPNPSSIFENCRYHNYDLDPTEVATEPDTIIGEVEEGEIVIQIREGDISRG